jgi:glycosyltransferase involved in cell wall biosynthesis
MKILLSSYQCLPNEGSELGNGWNWARALTDRGHDVTVLTQPSHIIRAAAPPDIRFMHVDGGESSMQHFLERLGSTGNQLRWYNHYLRWQAAALTHAERQREQFDVVHHVSWGSLHLGCRLWRLPAPLVFGPIGGGQTAPSAYRRYFGRNWPVEMLRTTATGSLLQRNSRARDTLRNASVTVVTNSATETACRRLGARDVRYLLAEGLQREWVSDARTYSSGTPVVLWVGRLLPRKAPALALRAFAELRRTTPARLVMAGDGPLLGEMREMVDQLGLADDVDLLGRVPWNDMKALYDSASVFLFTSLRDSSGSQFLEAMGRGLPAVVLDLHGIGDLDVGPAALKVALPARPAELPGRLAAGLRTVLGDDEWQTRSVAAVEWAARQTWPAKAAEAEEIYAKAVAG